MYRTYAGWSSRCEHEDTHCPSCHEWAPAWCDSCGYGFYYDPQEGEWAECPGCGEFVYQGGQAKL